MNKPQKKVQFPIRLNLNEDAHRRLRFMVHKSEHNSVEQYFLSLLKKEEIDFCFLNKIENKVDWEV
jgi:ATP-dependent protease HslVU (ClpYQ) ATPase subunit